LGTIEDLIEKLKGIQAFIKKEAQNAIEENKKEILDLNKAQMLVLGVDSNDDKLGEYAEVSIFGDPTRDIPGRLARGLQVEFIDLRYTGEFQDSEVLYKSKDNQKDEFEYTMDATDPKWQDDLSPRWPEAIGLNEDNQGKTAEIITNNVWQKVDKYLSSDVGIKTV
jgi:hypothetical protein